jgi:hypothetical protein
MVIGKAKARHPRTIRKGYKMFLEGASEAEIESAGISAADLHKCKDFNQYMLAGQTFYKVGKSLGIPEHLSKRLFEMFCDWKNGQEIAYRGNITNVVSAYALLLEGADEEEMEDAGFTELEIEKAKLFTRYQNADMVVASICKETGLVANTVKRLRRMYRDSQNQAGSPELCMEMA